MGELRSPHWVDLKAMTVRAHAQPHEFNHRSDGPLDELRNGAVVENRPREVWIFDRAEAEEGEIT